MIKVFYESSTIGIDGCKNGWCCSFGHRGKIKIIVIQKIDQINSLFPFAQHILIDIPVGLESKSHRRDLDKISRLHLRPGRSSSVFTPPVREALNAVNYRDACDINFEVSGKKISIQSWNISKKILEVDTFIRGNKSKKNVIHESHPEICFKHLNGEKLLNYSKHEKNGLGIDERLKILSKYHAHIYNSFKEAITTHRRTELKADDVVDSLCLYVVGRLGIQQGFSKITGNTLKDEFGIDLNLYFFGANKHTKN